MCIELVSCRLEAECASWDVQAWTLPDRPDIDAATRFSLVGAVLPECGYGAGLQNNMRNLAPAIDCFVDFRDEARKSPMWHESTWHEM